MFLFSQTTQQIRRLSPSLCEDHYYPQTELFWNQEVNLAHYEELREAPEHGPGMDVKLSVSKPD